MPSSDALSIHDGSIHDGSIGELGAVDELGTRSQAAGGAADATSALPVSQVVLTATRCAAATSARCDAVNCLPRDSFVSSLLIIGAPTYGVLSSDY